ncbi:Transposase [Nannocystis exedens]|uniref:Transposase n=1 Tax=Nannocystis exedens TaxID=54 RepID=A0A1I2I3Z6_9BACT|nr:IS21 family transposase [Nannocystis exedens]PCC74650.1 integrase [Nannocystis exedens]SFF37065.1 Transposase [Nannocystis exedens]
MLDHETRTTILKLHREGHGAKAIARAVRISRNAVRRVLRSGSAEVPTLERPEQLAPHLDRVRQLHGACVGNLVRVHEELAAAGITTAYSCLTAFCRRHQIGHSPKEPAGRYHFEPGEEMQHDTSPHTIRVGDRERRYHCASLVLCYSRMIYAQVYPRWTRFECRVFLTEAIVALGGAASRCMLDNSSVIIARGRGADAVPADAMRALGERFGFRFVAHAVGDANRSARVERPFSYIENNFYPGRTFADDDDLNEQLRAWCDRVNRKPRRTLPRPPIELWAAEQPALRPLPIYVPEVYDVHPRRVDVEGYVNLHHNRYSVPAALIGRQVEVRETAQRIRIYDGHRLLGDHHRLAPGEGLRSTLAEHREDRRWRSAPVPHSPEERLLRATDKSLDALCDLLRRRHGGGAVRAIRRLHRIYLDYPTEPLVTAVRQAVEYGLWDLGRLESMVLRAVAGDFFRLPTRADRPPSSTPTEEKSCDPKDSTKQEPTPGPERHEPAGDRDDVEPEPPIEP